MKKRPLSNLDADIRDHIERETQDNIERGMPPEDARYAALRKFGNVTLAREDARAVWIPVWLDQFRQDVRYALRSVRRAPSFAIVAVLTLALGIGATTAIYSVVDTILLQPLPFSNSDRLVRLVENYTAGLSGRVFQRGLRRQEFLEWRARTTTLSDIVAFRSSQMTVGTADGTARLYGGSISVDTFAMLETRAMLGRTFDAGDAGNPDIVVLGHETWRRLFQSDPGVVGKTLEVRDGGQGRVLTIVGVLPEVFEFPIGSMDFYLPFDPASGNATVTLIGRLRPGVTLQAALDEANVLGAGILPRPANAPAVGVPRFEVQGLKDETVKELRPALRVLLAAVAVVLMIVCANVASLLLARGTARQREIAVRFAIGAGRGRIVRQVLTECFVLAMAGGVLGALLGAAGVSLVKQLAVIDAPGIFGRIFGATILPRGSEVGVDLKMFSISFGIATMACFVFGLLPALQLSRQDHVRAMGARGGGAGRGEARLRAILVVGQLVMATTLLVGAGLLINSFIRLSTVEKGYDASKALAVQLLLPGDYPTARRMETIEELLSRLRADSNVEYAGFSRAGVLIGEEILVGTFVPEGRTLDEMRAGPDKPRLRSVSEGFLPAMGIRFIGGRDFTASDRANAPVVVVLNRAAAAQLFGTKNAVGQYMEWALSKQHIQVQVVGVVEQLRNESLEQEPFPEVFVDYRQLLVLLQRVGEPTPQLNQTALGVLSFAVRTRGRPEAVMPAVRQIVRAVDPNAGIDAMIPVEQLVSSSVARPRFYAVLLGIFAGVAGCLAAIGIYGVLAYAVVQRTQEIGIRMALGAQRAQVLALVLRKGLLLTAIGVALGVVGAAAGTRLLDGMLFGITPLDLRTFVAVSFVFTLVAVLASYVPARRATKVNPMVALRNE
jgi:putative ABC transport system permease protein